VGTGNGSTAAPIVLGFLATATLALALALALALVGLQWVDLYFTNRNPVNIE